MADRKWYTAIGGRQAGPYSDEQLRALIASGRVTADTLVWCTGMENWTKAEAIPGLIGNAQRPPPIPSPGTALPPGAALAFSTDVRVWPLLGRSIVVALAQFLILPAPWAMTSFYRWFVEHLQVPGHQRVAFAGKPEDIWYIFMLNALLGYAGLIHHYLQFAAFFLGPLFLLIIARWFVRNLTWDGQAAPLRFTATYWPMLGWNVLLVISIFSIIGGRGCVRHGRAGRAAGSRAARDPLSSRRAAGGFCGARSSLLSRAFSSCRFRGRFTG